MHTQLSMSPFKTKTREIHVLWHNTSVAHLGRSRESRKLVRELRERDLAIHIHHNTSYTLDYI